MRSLAAIAALVAAAGSAVIVGCGSAPADGGSSKVDGTDAVGEGFSEADWPGLVRPTVPRGFVTGEPVGVAQQPDTEPAEPVALRVPSVAIEVALDPLGLDPLGALEVPADFGRGGWYTGAPRPGQRGPAVITAHVDSRDGPAPFFRLSEVQPGDQIEVLLADGVIEHFRVERIEQHAKAEFPTLEVYGNTNGPELRLITCGGPFDRAERSYRHNVIVWANQI